MTLAPASQRPDIFGCIRPGLGLLARRFFTFALLALALAFLPAFAAAWSAKMLATTVSGHSADLGYLLASSGIRVLVAFGVVIVNWWLQGCACLIATADNLGEPMPSPGELAKRAVALAGASTVTEVFILGGTVALVVPALLMSLAWCVMPGVTATEDHPFFARYRRAADLTRGHRVVLMGLFLVYALSRDVLIYGLRLAIGTASPFQVDTGPGMLTLLIQPALSTVMSIVYAAVMAFVFLELRRVHDGDPFGGVAATFD
jgi:hypothetical protein